MQIPFWKRMLSYLRPIRIEHTGSVYNPYLEILLINGRRQLNTKDAIYSYDDKYENFKIAFDLIDWNHFQGKSVLILGLGLGSVIRLLEMKAKDRFVYTAVEIDPEICKLVQKYTLSDIEAPVEVNNVDAEKFLMLRDEKHDLILMDIFQSAEIPKRFQSPEFLHRLKELLSDNGIILYNRMNVTDKDQTDNSAFDKDFSQVFPRYKALEIKQNFIFINNKNYLL